MLQRLLRSSDIYIGKSLLLILLLVALSAGVVRLLTYDRYLPVIDYVDEPAYIALAADARGISDQSALKERYGLLAPLYVWVNIAVQEAHQLFNQQPWVIAADYFYSMRLVSVAFGVMTALTIAWLGWQLANGAAALMAGLIWALSPIIVDLNNLVIPDPMLYAMSALVAASAVFAWRRRSIPWLTVSLFMGIAAIYTKLWIATAVLPFLIASVGLLVEHRHKLLRPILALYALAMLFAIHFVFYLNPFDNTWKINLNIEQGNVIDNLLNLDRIINNFLHAVYPVDTGTGAYWIIVVLGVGAYAYARCSGVRRLDGRALLLTSIYFVASVVLSAAISYVNIDSAGRMRHILPSSTAAIALWAACLAQILWSVEHVWRSRRWYGANIPTVVTAAAFVFMITVFVRDDRDIIARYARDHVVNQALAWFDSSPPRDGLVLLEQQTRYGAMWDRYWGAYTGSKTYEWWTEPMSEIIQQTAESYIERNIRWFVLTQRDIERASNAEILEDFLDHLLLVKTFNVNPNDTAGDTLYIYRFEQPRYSADMVFDDTFRLTGYDLNSVEFRAGETLAFRPYWRLEQPTPLNLSLFLHVYRASDVASSAPQVLAQVDGAPLNSLLRLTTMWTDEDELYFGEPFQLVLPDTLPSGDYMLALGLYDSMTGERLTLSNNAPFYAIPIVIGAD